jgi:hypothetical protein
MYILGKLVDEVDYERNPGSGNRLLLTKRL